MSRQNEWREPASAVDTGLKSEGMAKEVKVLAKQGGRVNPLTILPIVESLYWSDKLSAEAVDAIVFEIWRQLKEKSVG